ncbi:MAG: hypothetical protein ACRD6W_05015 [Nitrososphaerales archaeon]
MPYVDGGPVSLVFTFENRSSRAITLVNAQTREPQRSLLTQTGTVLKEWKQPRCPRNASCPLSTPYIGDVNTSRIPEPVTIPPNGLVAADLAYRLANCQSARSDSTGSADALILTYRYGNGPLQNEQLSLASQRLLPDPPTANDCLAEHSDISFGRPYATSSAHTVPGTYGDTCTETSAGGLLFQSAAFAVGSSLQLSITIHIPHFNGPGLYQTPGTVGVRGPAQVMAPSNLNEPAGPGNEVFYPTTSSVTVTEATPTTLSGRFHARLIVYHSHMETSGNWRCTTLTSPRPGETESALADAWQGRYLLCTRCAQTTWIDNPRSPTPLYAAVRFTRGRVSEVFTATSTAGYSLPGSLARMRARTAHPPEH